MPGTSLLLVIILLTAGILLTCVGMSPSVRYKALDALRGGRSWSHNTEVIVSWLSFILGMGILSMFLPYHIYLLLVVASLIYFVSLGR